MAMLPSDSSHQVECSPYRTTHGRNEGAGNLGASWYFSRKELEENSPSRRDGMDLKKESSLRKSYCTYIQELGMKLKVPQCTIATAMVFCHRFFLRQSHVKNDRRTIATVCMFLAGKVEETPRPLKDVILVSYELIHKKDPAAGQRIKQREIYDQQKELILLGERVVLATLGFDLNVHHPYKPLVEAIKKFNVAQSSLAQVAWNFVNDGLRTSLCLQFKPHHVAAGALYLAAKFLKVKLPSDGDKVWYLEFGVTPRQLEEVSNQILEMYEQNRAAQSQPSHGNEAGGSSASVPNQQVSKKAQGSSEEPPAYGHHQASKQLNSNHSTPTGAPVHNVVEQSNADKSQRILQTDNGDHVSNKTTDSQSGVEQSNPDKQVESQKVIQNDIADHGSNKITNSQSGVEQSNPDNQVGSQKVLQNDGDRGSNKITNSQTDVERSNPGKQVGSHNVLQNDNGGDHGSNKTTNNQSGDEVDAVTKDSLHADREALPETVMEEQKPVPSHGPSNETGDVTLINNDGPSVSSSMMDAMNKIDKDKVKAALEKRRKLKGDVARKVDLMDDDDLLESEIEHGVELAFEDEGIKQERSDTCPQSTMRHNHDQKAAEDTDNGHRGEQNMPEIARGQVSDGQ